MITTIYPRPPSIFLASFSPGKSLEPSWRILFYEFSASNVRSLLSDDARLTSCGSSPFQVQAQVLRLFSIVRIRFKMARIGWSCSIHARVIFSSSEHSCWQEDLAGDCAKRKRVEHFSSKMFKIKR